MKKIKIIYYVSKGIISVAMHYITNETIINPELKVSMARLGFSDYFRIKLGIKK